MPDPHALTQHIRDLPDHPLPGVVFRDITPLLGNGAVFARSIGLLADPFRDDQIDKVVAVEARGFVFGAPVASTLGAGFVPVRKPGKLPAATHSEQYTLEYGTDRLEIHTDGLRPGERVVIVDDVLATGGTARATAALVERCGATLVGFAFLIDLTFLPGRDRLAGHRVHAVIEY